MTDGDGNRSRSLVTMWPFCSMTVAFSLARRTTARLTLHTLRGWKSRFSTRTFASMTAMFRFYGYRGTMGVSMTTSQNGSNGHGKTGTWTLKTGLAQMLKGGVIMDVVTADHARIAEEAGAVAVMALERVPADIRATGGVARMSDPKMIEEIMDAVTIPVMAKARIGHFVEARVLEALGVDYIDESEVLTPADEQFHIDKHGFKVPFVCGARDLGEALRRINEG